MRKLVVVTNIPTPYRVPLFNTLHHELAAAGWELHVVFGSRGNARRLWQIGPDQYRFPHTFLEGRNLRLGTERIINTYGGLGRLLRDLRPTGLVCTGFSPGTMAAARYAKRADVPLAIWSGAIPGSEATWWRRLQRRWLVGRSSGFLAYGTRAKDYLVDLGAPAPRVHYAWNTVDTSRFDRLPGVRRPEPGAPLRVLTVGYLERRKRVDLMLDAVAQARALGYAVELDVVGDGGARPDLEARSAALSLNGAVRFHGYRDYGELEGFYAQAHLFAFSTARDIWGLVLCEAMAAGLPCLASVRAGATHDLVVDGETGFAVDFERRDDVVGRLAALAGANEWLEPMGQAGRNRIKEHFTLAHSSRGWVELVEQW